MKQVIILFLALWCHTATLSAQQVYEIWFTSGSVRHHGLVVAGDSVTAWQMRVKYFDTGCKCQRLIEQQLRAETTNLGTLLYGQSVRDVPNNRPTRDYAADRLYVYRDKQGNLYSRNLDEQGASSEVLWKLLSALEQAPKLKEFGWIN